MFGSYGLYAGIDDGANGALARLALVTDWACRPLLRIEVLVLELSLGEARAFVNSSDLLVKPAVAQAQIEADAAAARAAAEKVVADAGTARDDGGFDVEFGGTTTVTFDNGDGGTSTVSTTEVAFVPKRRKTTFHMASKLDNTRVNRGIQNIMDEVVSQLNAIGADVELAFEVRACVEDGIPPETVRAVSENCSTLGVGDFGFGG